MIKREYTKAERREIARVFRGAKRYLSTGKYGVGTSYICSAIAEVPVSHRERDRARQVIHDRLDGNITVMSWLARRHGVNLDRTAYKACQAYRHRWLDSLIKEFSA